MANCAGQENLIHALTDLDETGFDVRFVFFSGMVEVDGGILSNRTMLPAFTVVAREKNA